MEANGIRGALRTLLRLWWLYARMDFLWITRVPKLFLTFYLSDAILNIASVTAIVLLAERFDGIGAWTQPQIIFMLGYATIVTGLVEMFFGYNVLYISRRVGRGQLDHILVQPQPMWLSLLTEGFLPFSGSAILLPGFALLAWAIGTLGMALSAPWIGWLVLNIVASATIMLAFSYAWGSLAFWSPRGAEELSTGTLGLMNQLKIFPLDGLGAFMTTGLLTFLPTGFIAWMPCRFLMGIDARVSTGLATPIAAIVFSLLAIFVFKKGMVQYGHTGSQRYLSFGHRG